MKNSVLLLVMGSLLVFFTADPALAQDSALDQLKSMARGTAGSVPDVGPPTCAGCGGKGGQRWQVETVFSMFKRNLGSALRARYYHSQTREIRLHVLTNNVMILLCLCYVLYRALTSRFSIYSTFLLHKGSEKISKSLRKHTIKPDQL